MKKNSIAGYHKVMDQTVSKETALDVVVPDTMPDVTKIVTVGGDALIRSKDVSQGKIRLEANVPARVAYRAEEENALRCLDVNLPIAFSVEENSVRDGCQCRVQLCLKALDARILNPRKLSVNAIVEAAIACYGEEDRSFLTADGESAEYIHVQECETEISEVCCVTEKTFVLTDEYILPQGGTPIEKILDQNASLQIEELKAVGNKLILKGTAHSRLIYCSEVGSIAAAKFDTAFSQIVDTDCDTENARAFAQLLLSGLYYDIAPGFDGKSVKMELHAVAQIQMYQTVGVRYIRDAYSNRYALQLTQTQAETELLGRELALRNTVHAQIELTDQAAEITYCDAEIVKATSEDGAVQLQIRADLCCRSMAGENMILRKLLSAEMPAGLPEGETLLISGGTVSEQFASPAGSSVDLRMTVEISGVTVQRRTFDCVSGAAYDEAEERDFADQPSLVMMRVRSDEDLWEIARANLSTVEAISEVNRLEELASPWEKLLLIPRTD